MLGIERIIFIVDTPFSRRDHSRFGVETFERNGFHVEAWDITQVLHPDFGTNLKVPDPISWAGCRHFKRRSEVREALRGLAGQPLLVCNAVYTFQSYWLFREISRLGLKYMLLLNGAFPSVTGSQYSFRHYYSNFKVLTPARLMNSLFARIPFRYLGISPALIMVAGGEKSIEPARMMYPVGEETRILWTHAYDYDNYLNIRESLPAAEARLGVFLDEYRPFHADYLYNGVGNPHTPKAYYGALRRLFSHLEQAHDCRILVAAHPRSCYESHPDYFGGRPAIRGRTAELVGQAGFVITHMSASTNYAVMFKKPVIFVSTDEIQRGFEAAQQAYMSSLLGKKVHNLDESVEIDLKEELRIDDRAYSEYSRNYIKKPGSPELLIWQSVSDALKGLSRE